MSRWTIVVSFFVVSCGVNAQGVFRCDVGGKSVYQDAPCSAAATERKLNVPASDREKRDQLIQDIRKKRDAAKLRCETGDAAKCDFVKLAERSIQQVSEAGAILESIPAARMNEESQKANARINHKIALDDYNRADARVQASIGNSGFDAALAARSATHSKLLAARNAYYKAFKEFPVD
jgi:hypothetical protein